MAGWLGASSPFCGALPARPCLQPVGPFPASLLHLASGDHLLAHRAPGLLFWYPTSSFPQKRFTVAEIAIGLLCIYLLRHGGGAEALYANPETERPPLLVSLVAALLGIILGGAIGACAGFFAGSLIADATHMSCFEGACGFFAAVIGLAGLIVGAIAGGIFAIWGATGATGTVELKYPCWSRDRWCPGPIVPE
ncbi:hypothetical protein [Mesorhizobium sp. M0633]|uniref:hypothetical protein n=1 Tax=Mesorhizobium sp. M0633 TaxID=2956977 RepID=UPI00333946DB